MHRIPASRAYQKYAKRLLGSIWFFPGILTILLAIFTLFAINGSSMGTYHTIFYGAGSKDPDLLAGAPRPIRSDEYLVNTQLTIAQEANGYARVNKNIGNGQDLSVIVDEPYKDWSIFFKPQNLGFFVLPFDNAFAFRWWVIAYLLVMSCYLFTSMLLPKKKLFAALIAVALLFSPFIQWWYLYGTLSSIYYALFGGIVFMKILHQKSLFRAALWAIPLVYIVACFAMVLYPPFQIPCALAMLAFVVGYTLEQSKLIPFKTLMKKLGIASAAAVAGGAIVGLFYITRGDVFHTVTNTIYPGKRHVVSGGFNLLHLFSSHLQAQFQDFNKAQAYQNGTTNQSESSNFLLLSPFLLPVSLFLMARRYYQDKTIDWPLVGITIMLVILLAWMLVPGIPVIGKLFLLNIVPPVRIIIGLGLLGTLQLILLVRYLAKSNKPLLPLRTVLVLIGLIFIVELLIGLQVRHLYPLFIGKYRVIAFALPIPIIVGLLLRRRPTLAAAGLLAFSLFLCAGVNPLYRGTSILTDTPLSHAIKDISAHDSGSWAAEDLYLENFAFMNGARSVSAVFIYPQPDLWKSLDKKTSEPIYNRYAHVGYLFERGPGNTKTTLRLEGTDHFNVMTEPCSDLLRRNNVHYIMTQSRLNPEDTCAKLVKTVIYPTNQVMIYRIN